MKEEEPKFCPVCDDYFYTTNDRKIYCGVKCSTKAANQRNAKKRKKYKDRPRKWKDRRNESRRARAALLRSEVYLLLGGVCNKCGFNDSRAFQIDHINGGGCTELRSSIFGNKITYYRHVIKSVKANENKYQLLCANCNWIKRHENDEH